MPHSFGCASVSRVSTGLFSTIFNRNQIPIGIFIEIAGAIQFEKTVVSVLFGNVLKK